MTIQFQAVKAVPPPGRFIDQLFDWREFEAFVQALYAEDPNLVVEHDVTEEGKSGARRQTDVKVTQRNKLHTFVTLVECKRWKDKVDRQRVDVLAASIEDLGASKGVIFTTSGYEAGAEKYAKSKNIDLFVVRDLTDAEWGLPGRKIWFYMHYWYASIESIMPGKANLLSVVDIPPKDLKVDVQIFPDSPHDEALTLYSVTSGERGPNLASLILDSRVRAMQAVANAVPVLEGGVDGSKLILLTPVTLELEDYEFRQLLYPYGGLRMPRIGMRLKMAVHQTKFEFDRGTKYDFALAVENFVTRQRNVVARVAGTSDTTVSPPLASSQGDAASDVLQNGSLLRVFTTPFVPFPGDADQVGCTNEIIFELPSWKMRGGATPPLGGGPTTTTLPDGG
jgi:hypothetical protein